MRGGFWCRMRADKGKRGALNAYENRHETQDVLRRKIIVVIGMRRNDDGIDDSLVLNVWLFNGNFSLLIKSPRLLIYISHSHSYQLYQKWGNVKRKILNYWMHLIAWIALKKTEISVNCIIFLLYFSLCYNFERIKDGQQINEDYIFCVTWHIYKLYFYFYI